MQTMRDIPQSLPQHYPFTYCYTCESCCGIWCIILQILLVNTLKFLGVCRPCMFIIIEILYSPLRENRAEIMKQYNIEWRKSIDISNICCIGCPSMVHVQYLTNHYTTPKLFRSNLMNYFTRS